MFLPPLEKERGLAPEVIVDALGKHVPSARIAANVPRPGVDDRTVVNRRLFESMVATWPQDHGAGRDIGRVMQVAFIHARTDGMTGRPVRVVKDPVTFHDDV